MTISPEQMVSFAAIVAIGMSTIIIMALLCGPAHTKSVAKTVTVSFEFIADVINVLAVPDWTDMPPI